MHMKRAAYLLISGLLCLVGAVYSAKMALSQSIYRSNPAMAVALDPTNVAAQNRYASTLLVSEGQQASTTAAMKHAKLSVSTQPLNANAYAILGQINEQKDPGLADSYYQAASKLSKRNLSVNLWHIRQFDQSDEVEDLLKFYARSLATDRRASDLLLPTMARVFAIPKSHAFISKMIANTPPWMADFDDSLINEPLAWQHLADFMTVHHNENETVPSEALTSETLLKLSDSLDFAEADRLHSVSRQLAGLNLPGPEIINDDGTKLPFAWKYFTQSENYVASSRFGMEIEIQNADGKLLARKLVRKPETGSNMVFKLAGTEGVLKAIADQGLSPFQMTCAKNENISLLDSGTFFLKDEKLFIHHSLRGQNCDYMWLRLLIPSSLQLPVGETIYLESAQFEEIENNG
jgi:hypothetical protein